MSPLLISLLICLNFVGNEGKFGLLSGADVGKCRPTTQEIPCTSISEAYYNVRTDNAQTKKSICTILTALNPKCKWDNKELLHCAGMVTTAKFNGMDLPNTKKLGAEISAVCTKAKNRKNCKTAIVNGALLFCEWVTKKPYKKIVEQRRDYLKKQTGPIDLNTLEVYTGFGEEPDDFTMKYFEFKQQEIDIDKATAKKGRAHTASNIGMKPSETCLMPKGFTGRKSDLVDGTKPGAFSYDLRKKIPDHETIPGWKNIIKLAQVGKGKKKKRDTIHQRCSGVLIAADIILTAAHCVLVNPFEGTVYGSDVTYHKFKFIPGMRDGKDGLRHVAKQMFRHGIPITEVYIPLGYVFRGKEFPHVPAHNYWEYDYALLRFTPTPAVDHWMSFGYNNDDSFWQSKTFYTAGFPYDMGRHDVTERYEGKYMLFSPHEFNWNHVTFKKEKKQKYLLEKKLVNPLMVQDVQRKSWRGQSGSGVWVWSKGINEVMGVLHGSSGFDEVKSTQEFENMKSKCTQCEAKNKELIDLRTQFETIGEDLTDSAESANNITNPKVALKKHPRVHHKKLEISILKSVAQKGVDLMKITKLEKDPELIHYMGLKAALHDSSLGVGTAVMRINDDKFWRWIRVTKQKGVTYAKQEYYDNYDEVETVESGSYPTINIEVFTVIIVAMCGCVWLLLWLCVGAFCGHMIGYIYVNKRDTNYAIHMQSIL